MKICARPAQLRACCLLVLIFSTVSLIPPVGPAQAAPSDFSRPLAGLPQCGAGEPGSSFFTLAAVGDLLLHYNIQQSGDSLGYDYLFDRVRPYFQAADLAYANFEGVIAPGQESGTFPIFAYKPSLASAVKNAGIKLVSTANNHAIDRGPSSTDGTLEYLDQNEILHHGTTNRNQEAKPYLPLEITSKSGAKIKAGFISATYSTNGIPDPYGQVNMLWDSNGRVRKSVLEAVATARRETELVIAAVHWGDEYQAYPNEMQKRGAQDLAAAGVDILLGDHPHTVQPVEMLDNGGRKTLVIYSLGNFIAAQQAYQNESYTQTSLIFYAGIVKDAKGKVTVAGYKYLPVYIEYDTRPVPILPGQYQQARAHVLQQMRDPEGRFAVDPSTLNSELCPEFTFPEAPGLRLAGDFAVYFQTLGNGYLPRPLKESIALVGFPAGRVREELAGDCSRETKVLYTERQRLEWQPEADWPYRVVGTQLGAEVYYRKFDLPLSSPSAIPRREELEGGAFVHPAFKDFFNVYGGLSVFGYPLSSDLYEIDDSGKSRLVQYFERARFELPPASEESDDPLYRVQLGLLAREYPGINQVCRG